jgi:hypothetical protein
MLVARVAAFSPHKLAGITSPGTARFLLHPRRWFAKDINPCKPFECLVLTVWNPEQFQPRADPNQEWFALVTRLIGHGSFTPKFLTSIFSRHEKQQNLPKLESGQNPVNPRHCFKSI